MAIMRKGDFLFYADIGLAGTFVDFIEDSEDGYVKIKYVPFDTWGKKTHIYPRPIRKEHIKSIITTKTHPGVEERIMFIFTGEEGSIIKDIIDAENLRTIKSLQEEIKGLKKQIVSSRQEASDAQSGVSRTIEKLNTMKKSSRPEGMHSPYVDNFGSRNMPGFVNDDDENY